MGRDLVILVLTILITTIFTTIIFLTIIFTIHGILMAPSISAIIGALFLITIRSTPTETDFLVILEEVFSEMRDYRLTPTPITGRDQIARLKISEQE